MEKAMAPNEFDSGDRRWQFGTYLLDPAKRLLLKDGRALNLTPRSLDVLCYLVEHHERVVLKDELLAALWGNVVVEEGTLVRHVSFLRKSMQLSPDDHDVLVTVPGRGYRFVAPLTPVDGASIAATSTPPAPASVSPAGPAMSRRSWPLPWVAASTVVALAGWLGSGFLMHTPTPVTRTLHPVTSASGLKVEPSWSPDGASLAFTSDPGGRSHVWVQSADAMSERATTSAAADSQPDWSPDGRWLVFRSQRDGGGIDVAPIGGGEVRRVAGFGYRPRWSSNGRSILFADTDARIRPTMKYYVATLAGGAPSEVRPDITSRFRSVRVAWHPDGQRVSVWGNSVNGSMEFVTASIDGTDMVRSTLSAELTARLADRSLSLRAFAWAHSGRWIVFEGRQGATQDLWRVTVDPRTLAWTGDLERLTTGAGRATDVVVSPKDDALAFSLLTARTRLWSLPLKADGSLAGEGRAVTDDGEYEHGFDVAPDGSKLVYRGGSEDRAQFRELSLLDGRERIVASTHGAASGQVRWSPDGSAVAYDLNFSAVDSSRRPSIAFVSSSWREAPPLLVSPSPVSWTMTSGWSTDGRSVVGTCRVRGIETVALCQLPVSNMPQAPHVLAQSPTMDLYQGQYSPDGRFLSFMAVSTAHRSVATIYVVPSGGGSWVPITDGASFDDKPRWSPDGTALYFVSNRGGMLNVWRQPFDAAAGRPSRAAVQVTSFNSASRVLEPENVSRVELSVTRHGLILPVTEVSGQIWKMAGTDRSKW
jgi:Tol biopolymer transport system component/DNA-binding winged helix-turn-helix (wHTH) protein